MTTGAERTRSEYVRPGWRPCPGAGEHRHRLVDDADREALAALLLAAYRGTIDDEGEGPPEALEAIDFSLATIERRASIVLAEPDGALVGMSFVVVVGGRHYIDPVATTADRKRKGLATSAVGASLTRLHELGIDEVGAVITDGNTPSERLFAALGFERIGPWPRPSRDLASSPPK